MDLMHFIMLGAGAAGGIVAGLVIQMAVTRVRGNRISLEAEEKKKNAEREAAQLLREARVTAKSDALKIKDEVESELKERRKEVSQQEKRLTQKEETLDKKLKRIMEQNAADAANDELGITEDDE